MSGSESLREARDADAPKWDYEGRIIQAIQALEARIIQLRAALAAIDSPNLSGRAEAKEIARKALDADA